MSVSFVSLHVIPSSSAHSVPSPLPPTLFVQNELELVPESYGCSGEACSVTSTYQVQRPPQVCQSTHLGNTLVSLYPLLCPSILPHSTLPRFLTALSVVVIGIPPGGVLMAQIVAHHLHLPMDLIVPEQKGSAFLSPSSTIPLMPAPLRHPTPTCFSPTDASLSSLQRQSVQGPSCRCE